MFQEKHQWFLERSEGLGIEPLLFQCLGGLGMPWVEAYGEREAWVFLQTEQMVVKEQKWPMFSSIRRNIVLRGNCGFKRSSHILIITSFCTFQDPKALQHKHKSRPKHSQTQSHIGSAVHELRTMTSQDVFV